MKRETFTPNELKDIAKVVDCEFETAFILPHGEKIID
jgi:hypothetical protein